MLLVLTGTRPLFTDDPWPVDEGMFELEAGQDLAGEKEGYIQWKYGWGRFELDMGFPWTASESRELGGFELSTKWGFLSGKGYLPDMGLIACWEPGEGTYTLWGVLGKELGPAELLANVIYDWENPKLSWGTAGAYYPHEKLGLCAEAFSGEEMAFGGGIRLFPVSALLMDMSYHWAREASHTAGLGFTFDF
jgi:hypothetical protein